MTYSTDACPVCPDGGESRSPVHVHVFPPTRAVPDRFTPTEILQAVQEWEARNPCGGNLAREQTLTVACLACRTRPVLRIGWSLSAAAALVHRDGCVAAQRVDAITTQVR